MGRSIGAVVAGVVVQGFLIWVIQSIGHSVFPPPADLDPTDIEAIRAYMSELPAGAFAFVLVSYALGALAGGFTGGRIAGRAPQMHAAFVWGLGLVFSAINLAMLPHPVWFVLLNVIFFPLFGSLGGRIAARTAGIPARPVSGMGHVPSADDEVDSDAPTNPRGDRD